MSTFTGRRDRSSDVDFHGPWSFDRAVTRHLLITGLSLFTLSCALLGPNSAFAEEGEHALSAGIGVLMTSHAPEVGPSQRFAPVVEIAYRYAVDDFWELGGHVGVGIDVGGDVTESSIGFMFFESRYVIDALTWVPYLCIGLGALLREDGPRVWSGEAGPTLDLTGHAGLGVEWRPARSWSLGLVAKYHLALTDIKGTTGPIHVGFSASWYLD